LAILAVALLPLAAAPLVGAWERRRNHERPTVKWHFTTAQACRELKHLYPTVP